MSFNPFFCCPPPEKHGKLKSQLLLEPPEENEEGVGDRITKRLIEIVSGREGYTTPLVKNIADLFTASALDRIADLSEDARRVDIERVKKGPVARRESLNDGKQSKIADAATYAAVGQSTDLSHPHTNIQLLLVEKLKSKFPSYVFKIVLGKMLKSDVGITFPFILSSAYYYEYEAAFVGEKFPLNLVFSVIKSSDRVRVRLNESQNNSTNSKTLAESKAMIPTERAQSFSNIL